jgi:hypothetical protein
MTAKKALARCAARAAPALVVGLVVGGSATAASSDRTQPTAPTNLRVTNLSQDGVILDWDPSPTP